MQSANNTPTKNSSCNLPLCYFCKLDKKIPVIRSFYVLWASGWWITIRNSPHKLNALLWFVVY